MFWICIKRTTGIFGKYIFCYFRIQRKEETEESAKKEFELFLESTNLGTTSSDNHPTFREDERGMVSKVEELDNILHNVQPTALSECDITSGSENEQIAPYFSLELQ